MTWEKLWAVGRYDLRLTSEEFWHMVPRQFVALLEQRKQEHVRQEFGPAIIVSAIHSLFSKKRPDPTKFMPSYDRSEADDEMPWQEQMAKLGAAVSAVGG